LIFCGVETHVCVLHSVFNALEAGYNVIIAADAVSSRKESEKILALESARQAGAWVLSTESILFTLLKSSQHPAFKAVSKLIK
jgi:nicotinamidase-related amidase